MIKTEFCDLLGVKHPIIQAGMGPYSTNLLSTAVANAGAVGTISTVGMAAGMGALIAPPEAQEVFKEFGKGPRGILQGTIEMVKEKTRESGGIFAVNIPVSEEFIGSARTFVKATIDKREEDSECEKRLRFIITSAGNPAPWTEPIKKSGAIWAHVVPSVYHAKKAEKSGCDIIIASGHEGGAHIAWVPVHTMVLLPAVTKAVKSPVIGAGGFCDGATLAAALSLGAAGVQMGTRFIATQESDFVQMWKDYILEVDERDTQVARGLFGPMRFMRSPASMKIAEATIQRLPRMFLGEPVGIDGEVAKGEIGGFGGLLTGDKEKSVMLSGEVAGRIDSIPTVKELIDGVIKEAEEIIQSMPSKFVA
jgi:NAD(P)H-dependent flavin oxidoreductase YrpB (nitropropane dioxygenase family)